MNRTVSDSGGWMQSSGANLVTSELHGCREQLQRMNVQHQLVNSSLLFFGQWRRVGGCRYERLGQGGPVRTSNVRNALRECQHEVELRHGLVVFMLK